MSLLNKKGLGDLDYKILCNISGVEETDLAEQEWEGQEEGGVSSTCEAARVNLVED